MMVKVAIMKQQQLVGVGSRSQRSNSRSHSGRTQTPVLLSGTSAPVCVWLNWKTALDKYTIQALIMVQQLLITYLLIAELSQFYFLQQIVAVCSWNVHIQSIIPFCFLFIE